MLRVQGHHQSKGIQSTNLPEFIWTDDGIAGQTCFFKLLFFSVSLENETISKSSRAWGTEYPSITQNIQHENFKCLCTDFTSMHTCTLCVHISAHCHVALLYCPPFSSHGRMRCSLILYPLYYIIRLCPLQFICMPDAACTYV